MKYEIESKASHLADRLVPYTFLKRVGLAVYRELYPRRLSVLMVDFSCALNYCNASYGIIRNADSMTIILPSKAVSIWKHFQKLRRLCLTRPVH